MHKSANPLFAMALMFFVFVVAPLKPALGQEPMELTLEQAIEYALQHNYDLKNAQADAEIANRQVWEITASGLPQISGTVGYQYFLDLPTSLVPAEFFGGDPGEFSEIQFGTEQNLTATFSVNQLIFDGSYIVGLQAARIFRELARQNYQRSEIEIRSLVTETYYLVLATSQNRDIIFENLANIEKTLFETEKLFEEGFTDAINVDQLRLTVANLKNNITGLERQKKITSDLLKFQIGLSVDLPVTLTENLEQMLTKISLEAFTIQNFDPQSHIDFRIMLSQEKMELMSLRRQKSFYLPSISGSYTRQESAQRNEFTFFNSGESWFPTSIVGININIPIFSSGLRSSRVKQAQLSFEKAKNNTRMIEQSLLLQKQEADNQMETSLDKYNSEKDNLQLAERILNRTTIMHKEGLATSLELTQASDQLLTTQANYINAIFELLNAKNKLDKALGKL